MEMPDNAQELKNELLEFKKIILKEKKEESERLDELFSSLAKAQAEIDIAKTDAINPFYKSRYADLASVVKASRKSLTENNLSVIQRILTNDNGSMCLYTRLCHASGQWIESKMPINPNKNDIQSIGSYITYLKRYNYAAIVGVVTSDEDDDAESAMKDKRKPTSQRSNDLITKEQFNLLTKELHGDKGLIESILKGCKIKRLADLTKVQFNHVYERIKKIK